MKYTKLKLLLSNGTNLFVVVKFVGLLGRSPSQAQQLRNWLRRNIRLLTYLGEQSTINHEESTEGKLCRFDQHHD